LMVSPPVRLPQQSPRISAEATLLRPSSSADTSWVCASAMAEDGQAGEIELPPGLENINSSKGAPELPKPRIAYPKDDTPTTSPVDIMESTDPFASIRHKAMTLAEPIRINQRQKKQHSDTTGTPPDSPIRINQRQGKQHSDTTGTPPDSSSGEGQPAVRYCVYCGMKVPRGLVSAKFCVYCGQAHMGNKDEDFSPQSWSPFYSGASDPDMNMMYGSVAEKALVYQQLMASMMNPAAHMDMYGMPADGNYYMTGQWEGSPDWTEWQS